MPNDIAADADGDLTIQGGGLKISTDKNRDRNIIIARLMTMRGEVAGQPFLGFPDYLIGQQNDLQTRDQVQIEATKALMVDAALIAAKPIIRVVVLGPNKVGVLVQSNRQYADSQTGEKLVVSGDFWTLSDMPMTQLDWSEK